MNRSEVVAWLAAAADIRGRIADGEGLDAPPAVRQADLFAPLHNPSRAVLLDAHRHCIDGARWARLR